MNDYFDVYLELIRAVSCQNKVIRIRFYHSFAQKLLHQMIYLLLSILFAVLIYVYFRLISIYKLDEFQVIVVNYLVAVILGLSLWQEPIVPKVIIGSSWFPISIFIGISFIVTFYLFALSSAKAGMALTAVSSKMSVLLPVIAGFIFFGESMSFLKITGIILAIISFLLVFSKGGKIKMVSWSVLLLPILIFIGSGTNDTLTKYAQHSLLDGDDNLFLTTLFLIAFIFSLLFVVMQFVLTHRKVSWISLLFGSIVGVVNFGTMYFLLSALNYFEASTLFPILNVSVVLLTAFIGMFFFKEKLSLLNWSGILLAAISILIISIN